jgi:hypothetical protein
VPRGQRLISLMLKNPDILGALLLAWSVAACTGEQAYISAQAWQRNQCAKLPDRADYERCVRDAEGSYDAYKRQTETVQPSNR